MGGVPRWDLGSHGPHEDAGSLDPINIEEDPVARRTVQTELFEAVDKMSWTLGSELVHYKSGKEVVHLRRLRLEPFQVVTFHLYEYALEELSTMSPYRRFQEAMEIGRDSDEASYSMKGLQS